MQAALGKVAVCFTDRRLHTHAHSWNNLLHTFTGANHCAPAHMWKHIWATDTQERPTGQTFAQTPLTCIAHYAYAHQSNALCTHTHSYLHYMFPLMFEFAIFCTAAVSRPPWGGCPFVPVTLRCRPVRLALCCFPGPFSACFLPSQLQPALPSVMVKWPNSY